jgi:hypothetical protein
MFRLFLHADFCLEVELETDRIEKELNPLRLLLKDSATLAIFRLDERMDNVVAYIDRLKIVMEKVDTELFPEETLAKDLESLMSRLKAFPSQVQSWKKSAARCGADVVLSLVRIHCKDVNEDRLKSLKVANTKKLKFEDFMEAFIETATRIADGINLDTFIDPVSPARNA